MLCCCHLEILNFERKTPHFYFVLGPQIMQLFLPLRLIQLPRKVQKHLASPTSFPFLWLSHETVQQDERRGGLIWGIRHRSSHRNSGGENASFGPLPLLGKTHRAPSEPHTWPTNWAPFNKQPIWHITLSLLFSWRVLGNAEYQ